MEAVRATPRRTKVQNSFLRLILVGSPDEAKALKFHPEALQGLTPTSASMAIDPAELGDGYPQLWEMVRRLPYREQQLLALRYLLDLPRSDIADRLGVSRERIRQIEHQALRKLHAMLTPAFRSPKPKPVKKKRVLKRAGPMSVRPGEWHVAIVRIPSRRI